jgi:predicted MPP superfamily phosphohydrolase
LYFFAGGWLGLLLSLMIFITAAWLVLVLAEKIGWTQSRQLIGSIALIMSFALTGYGIWNGFSPIVKEFDVKIKNLPVEWQGKKIVQLTDVHLGAVNGAAFIKKIAAEVNTLKPEAVFITGDYFDGMDGRLDSLAEPLNELDAPRGIFYITGNHETYLGLAGVFEALGKTKVEVLNDQSVNLSGLTVVGVEYPSDFNQKKNIPELLARLNVSRPSILLYHEPRQIEEIAATGLVDLMLAGHSHNGQVWPVKYISRLVYGIYVTGLHQIGDFTEYTSVGTGTWGPPLRTGNRPEIVVITLR